MSPGFCGLCGGGDSLPHEPEVPTSLRISWSDIRIDELVGQGGSGKVFKGMWQGNRVAVKVVNPDGMTSDARRNLMNEAVLMSQLSHPCVARVFGLVDETEHLALVMCYYRKGTLEEFMTRPSTRLQYQELDVFTRVSMALQVAKGVAFLHDRRVLHGDLKTSNLLMDEQLRVYITDFGLARDLTPPGSRHSHKLTPPSTEASMLSVHISPPEVLIDPQAPRTASVDVYAFGIVLLEMMMGQPAFKGMNGVMIEQVVRQGRRPVIPADLPDAIKHVVNMCWAQNPVERPSAAEVVRMLEQIRSKIMEVNAIETDMITKLV